MVEEQPPDITNEGTRRLSLPPLGPSVALAVWLAVVLQLGAGLLVGAQGLGVGALVLSMVATSLVAWAVAAPRRASAFLIVLVANVAISAAIIGLAVVAFLIVGRHRSRGRDRDLDTAGRGSQPCPNFRRRRPR